MIIKRAQIKRFRAITEERTIDFSPGLNIIKGSNEAGKSSLRMAITKALFQDPTTSQNDVLGLTSWGTDEPWELALEFDLDGESYRITRSLKNRTVELAGIGPSGFVATNKNTVTEKIAEMTGCPSEVFFESTACLGQDELIKIVPESAWNKKEGQNATGLIAQRLQAKLTGIEEVDVRGILARLDSKIHRKDAGGPHSHLTEISEQAARLRDQKMDQEEKVNRIVENRRELNRIRSELDAVNRELPAKQELLNKNQKIAQLQKALARDRAQYDAFQRAKDLKQKSDSLDVELGRLTHFRGAEDKIEKLNNISKALSYYDRQRASLVDEMKTLEEQRPAAWMVALGLVLMFGGLAGLMVTPFLWSAVAVGFVVTAYWWISHAAWSKQVKSTSQKQADLEAKCQENKDEAKGVLDTMGLADYDQYERQLAEYTSMVEAKKKTASKLDALIAEKDWQRFAAENADLDIQMNANLKELEQLKPFGLEPLNLQALENEVKNLTEKQAKLERDKNAFEKFFEISDADTDHLVEIDEELQRLEQDKEFWERKRKVFQITRDVLEEAHKQTLSRAADLLEKELGRYIAAVTDGRYSQVKIDENNLSVRTFSPEKKDWVDATHLSRATQDQFYICARFALIKLITEGKKPPILLDDPFVNFHPKRLRKAISLLQELAEENQVLLFTCSDDYDYLGNVIPLD